MEKMVLIFISQHKASDEVGSISLICSFLKTIILILSGQFGEVVSIVHFQFSVQHMMCQLTGPSSEFKWILSAMCVSQRNTFQTLPKAYGNVPSMDKIW